VRFCVAESLVGVGEEIWWAFCGDRCCCSAGSVLLWVSAWNSGGLSVVISVAVRLGHGLVGICVQRGAIPLVR
jgi:hypothetical protein